ncbi:MAG TPA: MaoC/PaaZ C-terminal domain-containing protein [Thermoleophilaceae bacterium]
MTVAAVDQGAVAAESDGPAGGSTTANGVDPFGGGTFVTRARTVTEADVAAFCALTGDWHPQHSDAEWAKASIFTERVAHGLLVISIAVGLVPMDYDRLVALRRIEGIFSLPVRLGETIHVEGRVVKAKELEDGYALVSLVWRIVNQDGDIVARAHLKILWRGEHQAEAA